MKTVTVKRVKRAGTYQDVAHVTLHFSSLPDRTFGPYPWPEAVTDLTVSALLSRLDARNLVLDALAVGTMTREYE